jgi:RNA polymerase sigma-70 factor (ECF subfamily)
MQLTTGGDARAFDELVARHWPAVASLARYACGADLADEAAQAAFVSLWQYRDKYDGDRGTPRAWLFAIVRNRGIDLMRSRGTRQRYTVTADPHGWMIDAADDVHMGDPPDVHVERIEERATIDRLLATLPPAQRAVLELAYLDGLSQQEVAETLGIPLGTVKGRIRLGLEKLRVVWTVDDRRGPAPVLAAA